MDVAKIKEKLLAEMESMPVIDAHQHLAPEAKRLAMPLDAFSLVNNYVVRDLCLAGITYPDRQRLFAPDTPLEDKWSIFEPLWPKVRHTCYAEIVRISLKKFYGFDDITADNYKDITAAVRANNKPGIYRRVLRDACHIRRVLNQPWTGPDPKKNDSLLLYLMPALFSHKNSVTTRQDVTHPADSYGYVDLPITSFDDLIEKSREYVRRVKAAGAYGIKMRSYPNGYPPVAPDRKAAKALYDDLMAARVERLPEINPFYYYLLDQVVAEAEKVGIVVAVHTGYWNDFRDLSPLNMIPIVQRYPECKFDVFHMGYPFIRESLMLGHGFMNVWLNFCWLHAISQKAYMDALDEGIELLSTNRITAFGGDYDTVGLESTYGSLVLAKRGAAEVFARRIASGWVDFDEAMVMIRGYFHDNPCELYGIDIAD